MLYLLLCVYILWFFSQLLESCRFFPRRRGHKDSTHSFTAFELASMCVKWKREQKKRGWKERSEKGKKINKIDFFSQAHSLRLGVWQVWKPFFPRNFYMLSEISTVQCVRWRISLNSYTPKGFSLPLIVEINYNDDIMMISRARRISCKHVHTLHLLKRHKSQHWI